MKSIEEEGDAMLIRILLTAMGLAAVLYFQFFFDFKAYTDAKLAQVNSEPTESER